VIKLGLDLHAEQVMECRQLDDSTPDLGILRKFALYLRGAELQTEVSPIDIPAFRFAPALADDGLPVSENQHETGQQKKAGYR
jgi:hypothetical protein